MIGATNAVLELFLKGTLPVFQYDKIRKTHVTYLFSEMLGHKLSKVSLPLPNGTNEVIKILGELGDKRSFKILKELLLSDNHRLMAFKIFLNRGNIDHTEILILALKNKDCKAYLQANKVFFPWNEQVIINYFYKAGPALKETITWLMGEIGGPNILQVLLDDLENPQILFNHPDEAMNSFELLALQENYRVYKYKAQIAIIRALRSIGEPSAAEPLMNILRKSSPMVQAEAAKAIASFTSSRTAIELYTRDLKGFSINIKNLKRQIKKLLLRFFSL